MKGIEPGRTWRWSSGMCKSVTGSIFRSNKLLESRISYNFNMRITINTLSTGYKPKAYEIVKTYWNMYTNVCRAF